MLYVLPWGYHYGPIWLNSENSLFVGEIMDESLMIFPCLILHTGFQTIPENRLVSWGQPRIPARNRIGPHNLDIISVIVGNLLGDGWAENPR
jgi:hypothetical protein